MDNKVILSDYGRAKLFENEERTALVSQFVVSSKELNLSNLKDYSEDKYQSQIQGSRIIQKEDGLENEFLEISILLPREMPSIAIRTIYLLDHEEEVVGYASYSGLRKPASDSDQAMEIEIKILMGITGFSENAIVYNNESLLALKSELKAQKISLSTEMESQKVVLKSELKAQKISLSTEMESQNMVLKSELEAQKISLSTEMESQKVQISRMEKKLKDFTEFQKKYVIKEKIRIFEQIGNFSLAPRKKSPYLNFFFPITNSNYAYSTSTFPRDSRALFPILNYFASWASSSRLIYKIFRAGGILGSCLKLEPTAMSATYPKASYKAYLPQHNHINRDLEGTFESSGTFVYSMGYSGDDGAGIGGSGYKYTYNLNKTYKNVSTKVSFVVPNTYNAGNSSVTQGKSFDVSWSKYPVPSYAKIPIFLISDYILDFFNIEFSEEEWVEVQEQFGISDAEISFEKYQNSKQARTQWIQEKGLEEFLR